MEEVVRAFNFVIEKGWVSDLRSGLPISQLTGITGLLLGYIRVERDANRRGAPYVSPIVSFVAWNP